MKLVASAVEDIAASPEIETLLLSSDQLGYLERVRQSINPHMPGQFGWPHVVRAILDRIEESGIDLTAARNEEEIAALAAGGLRRGRYGRRAISERLSSAPSRRADRRASRANRPARDRRRSGTPPRSAHE